MITYPMSFRTQTNSKGTMAQIWPITASGFESQCAIPPEFEGPGGANSPEDLYALALTNCFVATFTVYAEKSKLTYANLATQGELIVDLDDNKKPIMKKFLLKARITGAEHPERLQRLAEKAFQSGFILNSVKTELSLQLEFS